MALISQSTILISICFFWSFVWSTLFHAKARLPGVLTRCRMASRTS